MATYFRQVPNFAYINRTKEGKNLSDYTVTKNLFKRAKLRDDIFQNLAYFEKYQIVGDERPDNVAFKIYDDETLDWIVLLSNNIFNITIMENTKKQETLQLQSQILNMK